MRQPGDGSGSGFVTGLCFMIAVEKSSSRQLSRRSAEAGNFLGWLAVVSISFSSFSADARLGHDLVFLVSRAEMREVA